MENDPAGPPATAGANFPTSTPTTFAVIAITTSGLMATGPHPGGDALREAVTGLHVLMPEAVTIQALALTPPTRTVQEALRRVRAAQVVVVPVACEDYTAPETHPHVPPAWQGPAAVWVMATTKTQIAQAQRDRLFGILVGPFTNTLEADAWIATDPLPPGFMLHAVVVGLQTPN
jgi:hypothetical protein